MAVNKRKKRKPGELSQLPPAKFGEELLKILLRTEFDKAKESDQMLMPDTAVKNVLDILQRLVGDSRAEKIEDEELVDLIQFRRFNPLTSLRNAHKYAIDLYYETYYSHLKGPPRISDEQYNFILSLDEQGLSHRQIAKRLGLPLSTPTGVHRSKDTVRHRLYEAKKKKR